MWPLGTRGKGGLGRAELGLDLVTLEGFSSLREPGFSSEECEAQGCPKWSTRPGTGGM